VPVWLSNALCRLTTGGTTYKRTLYTTNAASVFNAYRPVLITSITDVLDGTYP